MRHLETLALRPGRSGVMHVAMARPAVFSAFDETMIGELDAPLPVGPITSEVRELTAATIARVRGSDEAREGFAAFLDKRAAAWSPTA
jgi:hypothetical protein